MNQTILEFLKLAKHKNRFPPRDRVAAIKSDSARRGLSPSSVTSISRAYLESIESVLNEATRTIINNADKLNIKSEDEIQKVVSDALDNIFTEARNYIGHEFGMLQDSNQAAVVELNKGRSAISDHLNTLIKLRDFDVGSQETSVKVTGEQIGNIVIGPVNQSQLTASVQKIIQQGGSEAEAGRLMEKLMEMIGRMDETHKREQAELYDLIKVLIQQINLPKEEQSPSMIQVTLERIRTVGTASVKVASFINDNWERLEKLFFLK